MKAQSLKKQLAVSLIISLILLCVLSNTLVYSYIRNLQLQDYDEALTRRTRRLAAVTMFEPDGSVTVQLNEFEMRDFLSSPDASYFAVRGADLKVLARSPSLSKDNLPILPTAGEEIAVKDLLLPDGRDGRAACVQFAPGESASPDQPGSNLVSLTVAQSREKLDYLNRTELTFALCVGLLLISGAVGIVWFLVGRCFRKLSKFSDQVNSIDYDNLDNKLTDEGLPVEMTAFKNQFNELLSRLASGFSREKRFTANVSHELRTPITELRLLNEVALLKSRGNGLTEKQREYFSDALHLTKRMEHLVDTISALNRCDAGKQPLELGGFDLGTLILETWSHWRAAASEKKLTCDQEILQPAPVRSDKNLMVAILSNLFSNAVAYSEADTSIRCTLGKDDQGYIIEMINQTTKIRADELTRIAEPFWQKEAARSDSTHVGLGWPLIVAYCTLLNIRWQVEMRDAKEFHVRLWVPLSHDPVHEPTKDTGHDTPTAN